MNNPISLQPILQPKKNIDLTKWAAVACDQYTSQPKYWEQLKTFTKGAYSTLNLMLPEIYLSDDNAADIERINKNMRAYLEDGIFDTVECGMILSKRTTAYGHSRTGIVVSIDLEEYSYKPEDKKAIRATEGTVLDRIPPRVKIRENAPLELPHIMLLIDDPKNTVIGTAEKLIDKKLYDFELNMSGGHIAGFSIRNPEAVSDALMQLGSADELKRKYGSSQDRLLLAVGDGNHSLASAKTLWERIKTGLSESEAATHPARFALCEIINIYDPGVEFEPIHRAVFNVEPKAFATEFVEYMNKKGFLETLEVFDGSKYLRAGAPTGAIAATEEVTRFLNLYTEKHPEVRIDYIHGQDALEDICTSSKNAAGIVLPKMRKSELFAAVLTKGILPKKTFSMGEASEKRYYLECRKIKIF